MKINKILTSAFAISEDLENSITAKESKKKNVKIVKKYLPVGVFRVSRVEEKEKGFVVSRTSFDRKDNYFYVDMAFCNLYYIHKMSLLDKTPKLDKTDLIRRIVDYPDEVITTMGQLHEYGSIAQDVLDRRVVNELAREGYAEIYEPGDKQIFNFLRWEFEPGETIMRKYYVKPRFHIPNFDNTRYNLDRHLAILDKIDDTYVKDTIKYSHERICEVLDVFFNGKTVLKELTYMPYLVCLYPGEHHHESEIFYLASPKSGRIKQNYASEVKTEPVAFMTKMDVAGSVPLESSTINFSNVADMEEVKEEIRQAIIYPLTRPDLAKKYGKKGGGSILFYGPPGCGKTYIARATVGECGVAFFNVNTSDIVSGNPEAGAKNIHEVFKNASQNAPSIVFFDEIDALGGRRESAGEGSEKIIINQFLMEMDGVESLNENVLVIGATNAPWAIDPALRRAGRFTQQIYLPPPEFKTRADIFKLHTRKKPISSDVNYEKLAELTEGYSAADIKAVCDDALEIPWEEALGGKLSREVSMNDFLAVLNKRKATLEAWYKLAEKQIKNSGEISLYEDLARDILRHAGGVDHAVKPNTTFKDVADLIKVKERINKNIVYPLMKPELAAKFGKEVGGGILLFGPPGCGKTYIAKAAAGECNASFFNVKITDILAGNEGESELRIKSIFERAINNTPAILFFDEIDAVARMRDSKTSESGKRLVNQFLTEMDGFESKKGVMIIASTNTPWDVDPALRRAGRFTEQVYVPPPDRQTREEIFRIHTKNKPISKDVDFERLARITEGYASSDIKAICDHALEIPWEEAFHGGSEREANVGDFLKVISDRKSSLPAWFNLAEKQVHESGETELYQDLLEDIKRLSEKEKGASELKKLVIDEKKQLIAEELRQIGEKIKEIQESIEQAKIKYHKRLLDEDGFRELTRDYMKQLIPLEIKEKELRSRLAQSESDGEI